jgi:hypothetical protein
MRCCRKSNKFAPFFTPVCSEEEIDPVSGQPGPEDGKKKGTFHCVSFRFQHINKYAIAFPAPEWLSIAAFIFHSLSTGLKTTWMI